MYNGERRRKDDSVFMALGDVDELNSGLGLAHEYCHQLELSDICHQVRHCILCEPSLKSGHELSTKEI